MFWLTAMLLLLNLQRIDFGFLTDAVFWTAAAPILTILLGIPSRFSRRSKNRRKDDCENDSQSLTKTDNRSDQEDAWKDN